MPQNWWENDPVAEERDANGFYSIKGPPDPFKAEDQSFQREANARAQQAEARAAEALRNQGLPTGYRMGPNNVAERIPGLPPEKSQNTAAIPQNYAKDLQDKVSGVSSLSRALAGFKDDYSGAFSGIENSIQGLTGIGTPGQRDWWADFKATDNITRNTLFGASLTPGEQAAYESTSVTPNMSPKEIRANLERRLKIANDVLGRQREFLKANGYKPEAIDALAPSSMPRGDVQFGDEAGPDKGAQLRSMITDGIRAGRIKSPEHANQLIAQFNQQNSSNFGGISDPKEFFNAVAAARQGLEFNVQQPRDKLVEEKVAQQNIGAGEAAVAGFGDAGSVGLLPRAGAAVQAMFGDDQGSFGDRYNLNLDANRAILDKLGGEHPFAYAGGSLAGGLGLPMFGAQTPLGFARAGAGYGGAYGFNQGNSETGLGERAANAVEGMGAGAALGYALPKGFQLWQGRKANSPQIPPLVDQQTGELNQVLDAMNPAQRVAAMKDAGLDHISPGMAGGKSARVVEQGFNALPGSAGVMEDFNGLVARDLRRGADSEAAKFGSARTLEEGGSAIQAGARSWMGRAERIDEKVYAAIPIPPKAEADVSNTRQALRGLITVFQSNPKMAKLFTNHKLVAYLDALTPQVMELDKTGPRAGLERFLGVPPETVAQGGKLSWEDTKHFRSIIGEAIGEQRLSGDDPLKSQLRSLYAALSKDMRNSATAHGPRAIHAFERANNFHREMETRIEDGLMRILGPDIKQVPERAAMAVKAMAQGGRASGDLRTLAEVRASTIKSGAWDEIASTLIRLGGQPANSAGREFQPATFVNWYADMSEPARALLFKPELRKSLDQFVAVNQQLAKVKSLQNTSNTAPVLFGGGTLLSAGAAVLNPAAGASMAGIMASNWVMSKLWTNAKWVNWATGYAKSVASGNQSAIKSQSGRLTKLAATYPELREPIEAMLRAANDNLVGKVAASPDTEEDERNQYPY